MKKSLIFIAIFAVTVTLFAENESVSCESESGKCTYTLSGNDYNIECTCRSGEEISYVEEHEGSTNLPTNEECLAQLDGDYCPDADYLCENEAGNCSLQANGEYFCHCLGVSGSKTGRSENFSAEGCTAALEKECGTEVATPRTICTDSEIFNACVSYETTFTNTCFEPVSDEEIEAILDTPAIGGSGREGGMAEDIALCCQNESMRNVYKTKFECVEAAESCENKECCETCDVQLAYETIGEEGADESDTDVISPAPEDEDAANTEAPTDGETQTEDTADGDSAAPATDSEAPAEKEESKSDGCSMLFI